MDNQPHIRFSETPPASPKSCMKSSRKLAFEDKVEVVESDVPSPRTPRKSARAVSIRSPGDNVPESPKKVMVAPIQKPPDIQFSQHYDQSTPPPNCTSNGSYDFVESKAEDIPNSDMEKDPQLMQVASKFVDEIIETAKIEAANREKPQPQHEGGKVNLTTFARDLLTTGRGTSRTWYRRAHGTVSKWITNLCVKAQNSI